MRIRARLVLGFSALFVLFVSLSAVNLVALLDTRDQVSALWNSTFAIESAVGNARVRIADMNMEIVMVSAGLKEADAAELELIDGIANSFFSELKRLRDLLPGEDRLLETQSRQFAQYFILAKMALSLPRDAEDASVSDILRSMDAEREKLRTGLAALFARYEVEMNSRLGLIDLQYRRLWSFTLAAFCLGSAVYLLLSWGLAVRVTRPILELAASINATGGGAIAPIPSLRGRNDEIAELYGSFSRMSDDLGSYISKLRDEIDERAKAESEVRRLNEELETRVAQRTEELVRQERMAALGGMVAGVAHEISTPIGNSLAAASYLGEETRGVARSLEAGTLGRGALEDFLARCGEASEIMMAGLERTAELVGSFKKVAVDRELDVESRFDVGEYLRSVLLSLSPGLRKSRVEVETAFPENLLVYGYPGSLSQILSNLVTNSLLHAFGPGGGGRIFVGASESEGRLTLEYRDDGAGMGEEVLKQIFDPFFTTKRGRGGLGLGMNIVYNLVTQKLKGSIDVSGGPGEGMRCVVSFPVRR